MTDKKRLSFAAVGLWDFIRTVYDHKSNRIYVSFDDIYSVSLGTPSPLSKSKIKALACELESHGYAELSNDNIKALY